MLRGYYGINEGTGRATCLTGEKKIIILLTLCVALTRRADPQDAAPKPGWLVTVPMNAALKNA